MSTKSPVSSICLEACAKRGSSRSSGCKVTKPGRNAASDNSTRKAQARAWLALAIAVRRSIAGLSENIIHPRDPRRDHAQDAGNGKSRALL